MAYFTNSPNAPYMILYKSEEFWDPQLYESLTQQEVLKFVETSTCAVFSSIYKNRKLIYCFTSQPDHKEIDKAELNQIDLQILNLLNEKKLRQIKNPISS